MVPRTLEHTIKKAIKTFPAVLVTGPRQSGKTTLLRECFQHTHNFLSLENPDVRARAEEDPRGFLRDNPPPVILDEIQYLPDLLHYIKSAIDEDRKPGQWLLSGSQNFALMEGVSQSLAGRIAVLTLLPLSLGESQGLGTACAPLQQILDNLPASSQQPFKDRDFRGEAATFPSWEGQGVGQKDSESHEAIVPTPNPSQEGNSCSRSGSKEKPLTPESHHRQPGEYPAISLDDWLLRGSYPEIRVNAEVDRQLWCTSYIQTYLERDVRQIVNVGDLNVFHRFLRMCAARTGQILNMSSLSRDLGLSVPTVKKWLSILEASYQIYLLPPHFNNLGKRITKSPKLYFLDPGIATFLMGLHASDPLLHGPMLGPLFETMIISEWVKAFCHRGETPELYYWRSKAGLEVDLLLDRNGHLYPFEMKATATVLPGHTEALQKWRELAGTLAAPGVIVADIEQAFTLKGCRVLSWRVSPDMQGQMSYSFKV